MLFNLLKYYLEIVAEKATQNNCVKNLKWIKKWKFRLAFYLILLNLNAHFSINKPKKRSGFNTLSIILFIETP